MRGIKIATTTLVLLTFCLSVGMFVRETPAQAGTIVRATSTPTPGPPTRHPRRRGRRPTRRRSRPPTRRLILQPIPRRTRRRLRLPIPRRTRRPILQPIPRRTPRRPRPPTRRLQRHPESGGRPPARLPQGESMGWPARRAGRARPAGAAGTRIGAGVRGRLVELGWDVLQPDQRPRLEHRRGRRIPGAD